MWTPPYQIASKFIRQVQKWAMQMDVLDLYVYLRVYLLEYIVM
jgi:hypothetical protein